MRSASRWILPLLLCVACGWPAALGEDLGLADPIGWRPLTSVQLGAGYKHNVLLSSFEREDGPFVGAGLDGFLWRPVGDKSEFEGLLLGEHRQYFGVEGLNHEQLFFGLLQVRTAWDENWRGSGAVEYLYQDQVLDVSATEAEVSRARVRGHSIGARPSVGRVLGGGWLDLQVAGTRLWFADPLDDYWQVAPRLAWEWPVRGATEVGLSYEWAHRWYDRDEQRTATGDPVPGTRRVLTQQEVGLMVRRHWGEERQWRVTGRVVNRWTRDEASGFYDYARPQGALSLRYRRAGWEWETGGRLAYFGYRLQRVEADEGARRRRMEVRADVRVRRQVTESLHVIAEYQYERAFANQAAERYWVSTIRGGLEWEF
jgi:hypothetical protein